MPCVLIINLYYTSKINIIHSFISLLIDARQINNNKRKTNEGNY